VRWGVRRNIICNETISVARTRDTVSVYRMHTNQALDTIASKYSFSSAKELLGALELSLLDDSPTAHAPVEALGDVLDILVPNRSTRIPANSAERTPVICALNAAFQALS